MAAVARIRIPLLLLLLTMSLHTTLWAQGISLNTDNAWMDRLARPAGMIFAGTVTRIERVTESGEQPAVRITFRVDEAVRGCEGGESVEIAEWAGLWRGAARYRVGERVFLFLYPRNQAGMTSPVAGDLGVFEIGAGGVLRVSSAQAMLLGLTHPAPVQPSRPIRARAESRTLLPQSSVSKDEVVARIRELR
jgi:hypothetical protein